MKAFRPPHELIKDLSKELLVLQNRKVVSPYALEKQELYRDDFYLFVKDAFAALEGNNVTFYDNWHIHAVCEHLQACRDGQIKFLLLNMPPRCMKSLCTSVLFPAWVLAYEPWEKFIYVSYASDLSNDHSRNTRDLIMSPWYQEIFGGTFQLKRDNNNVKMFGTNKKGYRIGGSIIHPPTGFGANYVIADDANTITDLDSEAGRKAVNNNWNRMMGNRLNDAKTGVKICIQHRMHEDDLTGNILASENKDIVHLYLPMKFERSNRCTTVPLPSTNGKLWTDPRRKENELLWPEKFSRFYVDNEERSMGSFAFAGLYQQRPSPMEGSIFQAEDFQVWDDMYLPDFQEKFTSWDTAHSKKAEACLSAATTWGLFTDSYGLPCIMLLELYKDRVEFPQLHAMAVRMFYNYHDIEYDNPREGSNQVNYALIEEAASGHSLCAQLRTERIPVIAFRPTKHGDKNQRARSCSHLIASGRVYLRKSPKSGKLLRASRELLDAAIGFPNANYNDIIDSMSQVLLYLQMKGILVHENVVELERADRMTEEEPFNITHYN